MGNLFVCGLRRGNVIGFRPRDLIELFLGLLACVAHLLQSALQFLVLGLCDHARVAGEFTVDAGEGVGYHNFFLHFCSSFLTQKLHQLLLVFHGGLSALREKLLDLGVLRLLRVSLQLAVCGVKASDEMTEILQIQFRNVAHNLPPDLLVLFYKKQCFRKKEKYTSYEKYPQVSQKSE